MFDKLESYYKIHILDDSFQDPFTNKLVKQYSIVTADGCIWEKGLSYRALQKECSKYKYEFHSIANSLEPIENYK